jgi:hypothetical protein
VTSTPRPEAPRGGSPSGLAAALGLAARDPVMWVACLLGLLYLGWAAARPAGVFWSLDEGGKFIYLQNVLNTRDPWAALEYPGRAVDPDLEFVPLYFWVRQADQVYSWWAVGFPLLTLPLYAALGWLGLYVLPAAAGAACAGLAGGLVRGLQPRPAWLAPAAALLTGLATPAAFYSATFWEHTLSAAGFMTAVYGMFRALSTGRQRWLVLGGVAGALATWLRFDVAALMVGLLLALAWARWRWTATAGAVYGLAGLALFGLNQALMGHPISRYWGQVEEAGLLSGAREAGLGFLGYALFNAPAVLALALPTSVLAGGTLATGVAVAAPALRRWRWLALPAYAVVLAISTYVLLHPYGYRSVHGLVVIAPLVICAGWLFQPPVGGPSTGGGFFSRAVLLATLAYGAAYVARGWVAAGGLQWGPRYMLALYPLLTAAAVAGLAGAWSSVGRALRTGLVAAALAAVVIGVGFQVRGAYAQWETVSAFARAGRVLRALPGEALVTRCTWMAMVLPDLYWTGRVFSLTDFEAWAAQARQADVRTGYVVDMEACLNLPLNEVNERLATNPDGVMAEPFSLEPPAR